MGERDKPHSYRHEPSAPRETTHTWSCDEELDGEVDDEHAGGGWSPPEVDSGSVSPLRSSPAVAFCLPVSGFVFLCRLLLENIGGLFMKLVLGQDGTRGTKIDGIGATRADWGGPTRPGIGAAWALPFDLQASVR